MPQSGNALQEVYVCVRVRERCRERVFSVVGVAIVKSLFFFSFRPAVP